MQRHLLTCLLALITCWTPLLAQNENDDDFVSVSLLVADPSDILYSSFGHSCLRLQCPTHHLDYCFSYEGENVHDQFLKFFLGQLKMGMAAIPSEEFINLYKQEGRGLRQYPLTMPLDAKKRLWELLDNRVAEGMNLPYDYITRGCAQSTLELLMQAMNTTPVDWTTPLDVYKLTIRERGSQSLGKDYWSRFCLHAVVGADTDADLPSLKRIVVPRDLIPVLQHATIDGTPILNSKPIVLNPSSQFPECGWFSPMLLVCLIWLLAFLCWWFRLPYATWLLLALQLVLGLFFVNAVFIAHLPANGWNWLLIPFNPLPVLLWRWRRYWARLYALVLVIWILAMLLWPHQLTDSPYIVLGAALLLIYMPHKPKISIPT